MENKINLPNVLKKEIKLILLLVLFFGFINISNAQKNASLKTIFYGEYEGDSGKEYDYVAIGYINNNQFEENRTLTFLTNLNHKLADTIISGRCFYGQDGNAFIDGIWKNCTDIKTIRLKGIFKVSNNRNGIGISTNKKIGEEPFATMIPNTNYNLEIKYKALKLETSINNLVEQRVFNNTFKDYIINSKEVKLTFNNGDLFNGTVIESYRCGYKFADFVPNKGEYKYLGGEVANGEFYCSGLNFPFLLYKGTIVFQDSFVGNESWLKQYNLSSSEIEQMYINSKSITDMRNKAQIIGEERGKEAQEKKILHEQLIEKIRQNKQKLKNKLVAKYGENIGNKIFQGKLEAGMSKSMVSEVWKEEYFTVDNIVRDSQNFEVWEFNSGKMATDLINEYGKEDAYNIYFSLTFASEFGEIRIPRKLIFKNGKLTDVYK